MIKLCAPAYPQRKRAHSSFHFLKGLFKSIRIKALVNVDDGFAFIFLFFFLVSITVNKHRNIHVIIGLFIIL